VKLLKVTRLDYQGREDSFLAPYAVKSSQTQGRDYPEKEHEMRTPYQRDRDRIIYSTAFRRLEYKTQVFVNHEGDHYRTRLTHTLETSQIARAIARALAINEDLTETIALAHDLGHGPFGHAGEWALAELMKNHGGFEHNVHTLRIVEKLEESSPDYAGLNLTFETREGLKKHPERFYKERTQRFRSLEADVVDLADEIAYNNHDLDDGLRSELLVEDQLKDLFLWQEADRYIKKKYSGMTDVQKRRLIIRLMINRLVMDLVATTQNRIKKMGIRSLKDLQKSQKPVVAMSEPVRKHLMELKRFLHQNLYQHYRVVRMTDKGQRFLKALFEVHLQKPAQLPPEVLKRSKKDGLHRSLCDYLAGMTDRFAQDEYKRIFEPYERV
jgi:dGTPase